jgi:hypothetical protein
MSTQLRVFEDDELPVEFHLLEWKKYGRELYRGQGDLNWEIGEWLILGKDRGRLPDQDFKRHALAATKDKWGTLKNIMWVTRKFPRSRRRDAPLKFTHHLEVAKFDDEIQEKLLDAAVTIGVRPGTAWGTRELKDYIKAEQKAGRLPLTEKEKKAEPTQLLKIPIPVQAYLKLRDLAKRSKLGRPDAGKLVWWMASQYWKDNKDKDSFLAGIEPAQKKNAKP